MKSIEFINAIIIQISLDFQLNLKKQYFLGGGGGEEKIL